MTTTPTLAKSNSHSVSSDYGNKASKEQAYLYFDAEWRGQPCVVTMECEHQENTP